MSRKQQEFVPLDVVAESRFSVLDWQVELPPYVPMDEIGMDVERFERLAHLGGFEKVKVTDYSGDTTKFVPNIDGISGMNGQSDASSVAASLSGSVVRAPLTKTSYSKTSYYSGAENITDSSYADREATVLVNMSELTGRLSQTGQSGGLRSPERWSAQLNAAAAGGLRNVTRKNLLTRASQEDKKNAVENPIAAVVYGNLGLLNIKVSIDGLLGWAGVSHHISYLPTTESFIASSVIAAVAAEVLFKPFVAYHHEGRGIDKFVPSVFPGIHFDRLLAVEALTRRGRLVKPIKNRA